MQFQDWDSFDWWSVLNLAILVLSISCCYVDFYTDTRLVVRLELGNLRKEVREVNSNVENTSTFDRVGINWFPSHPTNWKITYWIRRKISDLPPIHSFFLSRFIRVLQLFKETAVVVVGTKNEISLFLITVTPAHSYLWLSMVEGSKHTVLPLIEISTANT